MEYKRTTFFELHLEFEGLYNSFSILLQKERAILEMANKARDEGTVSLMIDYIV